MTTNIKSFSFSNGEYRIVYDQDNEEYNIIGHLHFCGGDGDFESDEFLRILQETQFLGNGITNEMHWLNTDEYIILLPKSYQSHEDDKIIILGDFRYYICNHLINTGLFDLDIYCDKDGLLIDEFRENLLSYIDS